MDIGWSPIEDIDWYPMVDISWLPLVEIRHLRCTALRGYLSILISGVTRVPETLLEAKRLLSQADDSTLSNLQATSPSERN